MEKLPSRLLRKGPDGKFVEINPDGSVKEEEKFVAPPVSIKNEEEKVTASIAPTAKEKAETKKHFASSEGMPIVKAINDTATKFRKSGKEKIKVRDGRSTEAQDMGGPHILEANRKLSAKEEVQRMLQATKSERNTRRGSIPKRVYDFREEKIVLPKARTRGRTSHKVSWKLNRLSQRRGRNQSHPER